MDGIETTGRALVEHWKRVAEQGLMNENTARAMAAACSQVLAALDNWEKVDVRKLDVDDACRRFQNKRHKDFKPESLEAYKRRFGNAVKSFLEYVDDPSSWRPAATERSAKRERERREDGVKGGELTLIAKQKVEDGVTMVEYPFPVREGRLAKLTLPMDLKMSEVRRLTAYLNTLAVDYTPEHEV